MAKNHKKPNPAQTAKLLTAQNRKEFFKKLKHVLTLMTGEENTINLLPEAELDCIYHFRYQAVRVEAAEGHIIDPTVLKAIRDTGIGLLKSETIVVNFYGGSISLSDYLTIIVSILTQIKNFQLYPFKTFADFMFALEPFLTISSRKDNDVMEKGLSVMKATTIVRSSLDSDLYWTKLIAETINGGRDGHYFVLRIFRHSQKKITITIDGITRLAVRVGWGEFKTGMVWCSRPPAPLDYRNVIFYIRYRCIFRCMLWND